MKKLWIPTQEPRLVIYCNIGSHSEGFIIFCVVKSRFNRENMFKWKGLQFYRVNNCWATLLENLRSKTLNLTKKFNSIYKWFKTKSSRLRLFFFTSIILQINYHYYSLSIIVHIIYGLDLKFNSVNKIIKNSYFTSNKFCLLEFR